MKTYSKTTKGKIFRNTHFFAVLVLLIGWGTTASAQSQNHLEGVQIINSESESRETPADANALSADGDSIIDAMMSPKAAVSDKQAERSNASSKKDSAKNSGKNSLPINKQALKEKSPLDSAFEEVLGRLENLRLENIRVNNPGSTFIPEIPTGSTMKRDEALELMSSPQGEGVSVPTGSTLSEGGDSGGTCCYQESAPPPRDLGQAEFAMGLSHLMEYDMRPEVEGNNSAGGNEGQSDLLIVNELDEAEELSSGDLIGF